MSNSRKIVIVTHGHLVSVQCANLLATFREDVGTSFIINSLQLVNYIEANSRSLPENVVYVESPDDWDRELSSCDSAIFSGQTGVLPLEKDLNALFSAKPKGILHLAEDGQFINNPTATVDAERVLFVFPGSVVPLNSGSHQRAFNFLYNLKAQGYSVDALITMPKNADANVIVSSLRSVCDNVYVYKNRARKIPEPLSTLRWIEQRLNIIRGKGRELPDTFYERALLKPTESCRRWVNSLFLRYEYRKIIVSYAWMLDALEYIEHRRDEYKLICDTHDVQYVRNAALLNRGKRLFYSKSRDKTAELSRLLKCDAVLAISASDENVLKRDLKKGHVVRVSPGFDYALSSVKRRPVERPYCFGFIGGKMAANKKALELILREWWPRIKEYSPQSVLYVAGSVSLEPEIRKASFFDENIVCLGFVDNLADFYSKIDVSLNPVVVQGGLNFKSVEAVFAGKDLLTNALGRECLGQEFPAIEITSGDDIVEFMTKNEYSLDEDRARRIKNQDQAKALFKNKTSFGKFFAYFSSGFK